MLSKHNKYAFIEDYRALAQLSEASFDTDKRLSDRYAYIAKKIFLSQRLNLRKNEKALICKKCNKILIPGKSCSVRIERGSVKRICLNCGSDKNTVYGKSI
jgi:RNase P subunit RPR2